MIPLISVSTGPPRRARVDLTDSLGALREQLDLPRSIYGLWSNGDFLWDDHRSLLQLGVGSASRLVAAPKMREVSLCQRGEEPVSLGEVRLDIGFEEFLEKAAAALKVELAPDTTFVCECGRVFSQESAKRRRLPRRCCEEEEELNLTVRLPPQGERLSDVCVPGLMKINEGFNPIFIPLFIALLRRETDLKACLG